MQSSWSWRLSAIFIVFLTLLIWVRVLQQQEIKPTWQGTWYKGNSYILDAAKAGVVPDLMADFRVLDVFSIYYDAKYRNKPDLLSYIDPYLQRAQALDPKFFDVYRLAGSILAYDAKLPKASINLLQKGIIERPDVWEFPFYAGFIAHDLLNDDKLAFDLMSQVQIRKDTPSIVLTLASRFLASSATVEDAIVFLQSLLQVIPKGNQDGIKARIKELKEELQKDEHV